MPKRGWEIREQEATPEDVFLNRRKFLKSAGFSGLTAVGLLLGCGHERAFEPFDDRDGDLGSTPPPAGGGTGDGTPARSIYPADLNAKFGALDRPLTAESVAATYNNFYEFSTGKTGIAELAERFISEPWKVEVKGLVRKPATYDMDDLLRTMPMEERLYRHRCVEAWAMAVPWTGFPMKSLIQAVEPTSEARYVKMTTFLDPAIAPGQWGSPQYPWPYVEGLTMEEAMNELTLLVTGVYGHKLPSQHGAPVRLVTPWKYGYKNIKSIVAIEFTREQPATFWNTLAPSEYDFQANVDPGIPHPRWSQASERMIGTNERRPTLKYNGYADFVASLY
jgi:methionine sulfoxide reductase catalytic subunit